MKVRAIRDFSVEPFFDEGWEVKEGMSGLVYALDLGDGEIAVDFNKALGGGKGKGAFVLACRWIRFLNLYWLPCGLQTGHE